MWPDASRIVKTSASRDPLVGLITKLCYNAGMVSSVLYLLLIAIIQPCISRQIDQRRELNVTALLRLRRAVSYLCSKLKTTNVSVFGFNDNGATVERCTQTSSTSDSEQNLGGDMFEASLSEAVKKDYWNLANMKLKHISFDVSQYNARMGERSPPREQLQFEIKSVKNQVSLCDESKEIKKKTDRITDNIREIKGWFVNGKIS
ncbi:Pex17p KNAG_0F00970 [Huiozyma naganishii CBS 8797]|uniref:Uncharacterized protein n=1 Tax=Huiozyma naganishii (strain ATCC MYA-139 / BCRC 22969 / CBS 8797 / KCTC 17520 / NBRC 10181 / NCYC 3082 / Yp74L-3) TaxID=1071383 RepID=J7S886_HUIN7|nr:hypothetical protein KNAG_0F00970 [Kazachstania naganishii CBS 8797]CCK70766.1 hypothetical protein KNAG_0F00970 [Kazachstania naganishii CBS 8797]